VGRALLAGAGLVCVGIGAVGIFVPVLPTTPFLLLAAACFVRSSPRLHGWLLRHRRLGPYVTGFVDGGGMPRRAKRTSLAVLWVTVTLSGALVLISAGPSPLSWTTVVVLATVGVLVTRYIARKPTIG